MQQLAELDAQIDRVDVRPSRNRRAAVRRKVTVRLSEGVYSRLDVATDRPGVGKSMLVEAALEHFLNPAPSVEALLREHLDGLHAKFDHLDRDMRMIAEAVALHARYHLTVVPPLPESQQREAILLGDERFKVLAEQVDRRVRQARPLMQETIDRVNSVKQEESEPATGEEHSSEPAPEGSHADAEGVGFEQAPPASAKTDIGDPSFARHLKTPAGRIRSVSDGGPNPPAEENSGPESSRGKLGESPVKSLSKWRLILSVFLPFAAGYYLSFLFRTINASISPILVSDFGIGAAETGLLASVYFLVFAAAQIPIGVLLDRYGPRRVQSVLLVIAVGGATLFGNANSFAELLVGRAMIGLGVAASLMAGLKAIVVWFPRDQVAFVNGGMIMLGSLGAVTATAPTDWLLDWIGWRSLFEVLTIATLATAGLIYFAVPKSDGSSKRSVASGKPLTLRSIFLDPRFLRIAPLSATCIGSSWAMHSLWAASWLADVEGFDRQGVISQLFTMAIGISLGALLLGTLAHRLRKRGVATEVLLAGFGALFMLAELVLILRVPLPSILPWCVISVVGGATVLSYAIIADYFPIEIAARANGALNLLHFGWAFTVQYGIGLIVNQWASQDGHYPMMAYQAAFGLNLTIQAAALIWFALPWLRSIIPIAAPDVQVNFAPATAEGSMLEPSQVMDW
ncbi:MFS transporter [Bradyrhizobium erythrophlei]|uniref:MFS transporter n=1 Tax=Bradyrhizobium erythrophlei TaxID=1437360 RepID=UPI001FCDFF0F|nr:MFS transporter [Bradyrhizobium erythrophlei]